MLSFDYTWEGLVAEALPFKIKSMIFKLEAEELEAAEKFIEEQMAKDDWMPAAGERWEYTFIPTGLGTIVWIKDGRSGDKKDITCWDWW